MWEQSLYFNGNSSFPIVSGSDFEKTDLVNSTVTDDVLSDLTFVYPFEYDENCPTLSDDELIMTLTTNPLSSYHTNLPMPINAEALLSYKVYFPADFITETTNVTVYHNDLQKVIIPEDVISVSEAEQNEIYEARMSQIEALKEQERQIFEELQKEKAEQIQKEVVQQQESLAEQEIQRMEELQKKLGEVTRPIEN